MSAHALEIAPPAGERPNYLACVHAKEARRVWTASERATPARTEVDPAWLSVLDPDLPDDLLDLDEWAAG